MGNKSMNILNKSNNVSKTALIKNKAMQNTKYPINNSIKIIQTVYHTLSI